MAYTRSTLLRKYSDHIGLIACPSLSYKGFSLIIFYRDVCPYKKAISPIPRGEVGWLTMSYQAVFYRII